MAGSECSGSPIFIFFIKENWICAMTRHHAEPNTNILLTRTLTWDSETSIYPYSGWAFSGLLVDGVVEKAPSIKSVTHILQWWNLAELYLSQRRFKKYMNHVTNSLRSADISIFSPEISKFCYIKKFKYTLHFDT